MWFLVQDNTIVSRSGKRPSSCTISGGTQTVLSLEIVGVDEDDLPIYQQVAHEEPCIKTLINPSDDQLLLAGWVKKDPPAVDWYQKRGEPFASNNDVVWISEDLPVEEVKILKRNIINQERDAALAAGVPYNGYTWDSDTVSRNNLSGTVAGIAAGIPLPDGFTWRTADDQNVSMDAAGVVALGAAVTAYVFGIYAQSWSRKETLDNPATDTVAAIVSI